MNKAQSGIATMVLVAGVINLFGAVRKEKDITYPVVGGFIVLVLLLALAEADGKVAELFAGAYMITCLATNGTDLFNGINSALTSGKRFDPGPAGTAATVADASYSSTGTTPRKAPTIVSV